MQNIFIFNISPEKGEINFKRKLSFENSLKYNAPQYLANN